MTRDTIINNLWHSASALFNLLPHEQLQFWVGAAKIRYFTLLEQPLIA